MGHSARGLTRPLLRAEPSGLLRRGRLLDSPGVAAVDASRELDLAPPPRTRASLCESAAARRLALQLDRWVYLGREGRTVPFATSGKAGRGSSAVLLAYQAQAQVSCNLVPRIGRSGRSSRGLCRYVLIAVVDGGPSTRVRFGSDPYFAASVVRVPLMGSLWAGDRLEVTEAVAVNPSEVGDRWLP